MKNILAATDLSAPARHAVDRAALVSLQTGAALDLVHVASLAPFDRLRQVMGNLSPDMQQQVLDCAHQKMTDLAANLHERHGISPLVRVLLGNVLHELTQEADARRADLMVCGARGESFLRRRLLGSTAERMLGRAQNPLLVVKQAPHEHYRRVLVPVDFSPFSRRAILQVRKVAPSATLVLLHAYEFPFESRLRYASVSADVIEQYREQARLDAEERMQQLVRDAGLSSQMLQPLVVHGSPVVRIIEQEQELDCDLIAIGKRGDSLVEDFFLGSVTQHVLAESQCDLLVTV